MPIESNLDNNGRTLFQLVLVRAVLASREMANFNFINHLPAISSTGAEKVAHETSRGTLTTDNIIMVPAAV